MVDPPYLNMNRQNKFGVFALAAQRSAVAVEVKGYAGGEQMLSWLTH
jgi:hypothetical protein